jgi:hypothetical protein
MYWSNIYKEIGPKDELAKNFIVEGVVMEVAKTSPKSHYHNLNAKT